MYFLFIPVLALTVYASLAQPRLGPIRLSAPVAAILGAALTAAVVAAAGREAMLAALGLLVEPVATIALLMLVAQLADRAGLFEVMARRLFAAHGDHAGRLCALLFGAGVALGAVLTNDAVVLAMTPLVCRLAGSGPLRTVLVFTVLNAGNVVGAFVISNPINTIVARYFQIGFLEYAGWMLLPAAVSVVLTYAMLRWLFRRELAQALTAGRQTPPDSHSLRPPVPRDVALMRLAAATIGAMLAGVVSGASLGLPIWPFPAVAAAILFGLLRRHRPSATQALAQSVAWDVVLVMAGFFLMVRGIQATPLAEHFAAGMLALAGSEPTRLVFGVGAVAAAASALMNNHPAAYLLSGSLDALAGDAQLQKLAAFALLIGADLGPKLLPIGSLAALLWMRLLRAHGEPVALGTYVWVGVPVTLVALAGALATLALEAYWFGLGR